jgi:HemY protein
MRTAWILVLTALLIALGLSRLVEQDAGYVLIAFGVTTIELSLAKAILLILIAFVISYVLLRVLVLLLAPGGSLLRWFGRQRHKRTSKQMNDGLLAFVEGDWKRSCKELSRSAPRSQSPMLNYLLAARASQALGAKEQSQEFIHKAEQAASGKQLAIGLTRAEIQLQNGQLEESLVTLTRLREHAPRHPVVLKLLVDAYKELQDWRHLEKLLPEIRRQKLYSAAEFERLRRLVYCALLSKVAKAAGEGVHEELQRVWKSLPADIRKDARVIGEYSRSLIQTGTEAEAEKILHNHLNRHWDDELVLLYGKARSKDPARQLLVAEGWLKSRPNNASLLLSLGRLALANELWGKAREYFESSLKLAKNAEVYAELGRLLAHLGEHEKSTEYYQQGLLLSTHGLPELPQPYNSSSVA